MASSKILLNDGTSFVLLNDGTSRILLNVFDTDTLSYPVPETPIRRVSSIACMAQALAFVAAATTASPVSVDQWHAQQNEPVRTAPRLVTGAQQSVAFVKLEENQNNAARWVPPLSEPVRWRRLHPATQGAFALPYLATIPETITVDKWFQPISEPVRWRGLLPALHQSTIYTQLVDNTNLSQWYAQLSEPVRWRGLLPASQQATIYTQLIDNTNLSQWYRRLEEPVRFPKGLAAIHQQVAPSWVSTVRADWFAPLSEPVRRVAWRDPSHNAYSTYFVTNYQSLVGGYDTTLKSRKRVLVQSFAYANFTPAAAAETITADKWFVETNVPPKRKSLLAGQHQDSAFVKLEENNNNSARWYAQLSEPMRWRGLLPASQLAHAFTKLEENNNNAARWVPPLSEPVRWRGLIPAAQQATIFAPLVDNTTLEPKWQEQLAEPVLWRGLRPALHQSTLFTPLVDNANLLQWYQRFVEPVRRPVQRPDGKADTSDFAISTPALVPVPLLEPVLVRRLHPAYQQMPAWPYQTIAGETVTVDKWFASLTEPVRAKVYNRPEAFTYWQTQFDAKLHWHEGLSEPSVKKKLFPAAQQTAPAWPYQTIVAETVTIDKYYAQLSEAKRFRFGLEARLQQYGSFVSITFNPVQPTVVVTSDPAAWTKAEVAAIKRRHRAEEKRQQQKIEASKRLDRIIELAYYETTDPKKAEQLRRALQDRSSKKADVDTKPVIVDPSLPPADALAQRLMAVRPEAQQLEIEALIRRIDELHTAIAMREEEELLLLMITI